MTDTITASSESSGTIVFISLILGLVLFFVMKPRQPDQKELPPTLEELRLIRQQRIGKVAMEQQQDDHDNGRRDESKGITVKVRRTTDGVPAEAYVTPKSKVLVAKGLPDQKILPPTLEELRLIRQQRIGKVANALQDDHDISCRDGSKGIAVRVRTADGVPAEAYETPTSKESMANIPIHSGMTGKDSTDVSSLTSTPSIKLSKSVQGLRPVAGMEINNVEKQDNLVPENIEIDSLPVGKDESANSIVPVTLEPTVAMLPNHMEKNQLGLSDPPPQNSQNITLKDSIKKRPNKGMAPPQVVSDALSTIAKLQIVVVCESTSKQYRPRSIDARQHQLYKITMKDETSFDSVKLPALPTTFRHLAEWFARAYVISREGFPPHMVRSTNGYEMFQQMLASLMDNLVQQAYEQLLLDTCDDDETEDDLFSDFVEPAHQQESSPINCFLDLLEEAPCPVGRSFLDRILTVEMASTFLHRALLRLDTSIDCISKRATAVLILLNSPTVVKAWTKQVSQREEWLQALLEASAYCIPEPGAEQPLPVMNPFRKELEQLDNFPICVFDHQNKEIGLFMGQTRLQMQAARNVAERLLCKGGKDITFAWLSHIVNSNDALATLLLSDLLSTANVGTVSRGFLMGLAASLVSLNCDSLIELFHKDHKAFDHLYFQRGRLTIANEELMLVRNQKKLPSKHDITFTGGTEFFFLTCGLLRVSLYPCIRMEEQFKKQYSRVLELVRQAANEKNALPAHTIAIAKPVISVVMGWMTFLDDPELVAVLTKFSILQLEWVVSQEMYLGSVPEWMVKNPAIWLEHVARTQPRLLKPYQAEAVVECAIQLLQLGTKANDRAFSPVVVDNLVKIIAAFVSAGVSHARQRQKRHRDDDSRDVNLYLSFDANDLGVAVFTNHLVSGLLCPTLMQTFGAVDVVEGLDVDKEHGFDKFSAKVRIAELFLRLWSHPNGECRASVCRMGAERVAQFAKELQLAVGVLLDFSCNRMADICNGMKNKNYTPQDNQFLLAQGHAVSSELYCARLCIMVLCIISEEPLIRKILGMSSLAHDLASLMIHFVDILTDPDGGIHRNLDLASQRSAQLVSSVISMNTSRKQHFACEIIRARFTFRYLFGLDVATFCHQFLAMMASWHNQARDITGHSPFLEAFALHDDYEEDRYRNIVRRLIAQKPVLEGAEGDSAYLIFDHDGHVDMSNLVEKYQKEYENDHPSSPEIESQKRTAKKDQMAREDILAISSIEKIMSFLDDAEACKKGSTPTYKYQVTIPPDKLDDVFDTINMEATDATPETYRAQLTDWLVTSESFRSKNDVTTFSHYYGLSARTRGVACSGKIMVKEAWRCHKNLPTPHPNSAAFCCFGEERMDLCRACITGPVDTPYALGIFVFDVFFPSSFPSIPPLVTFMTTGDGQTRFNPNLYSDGKVCLSLLGTFHSQDGSQKWNPGYSSLAQILLSIQTQLLVEQPYFNEPGNEIRQGTPAGAESSDRYNLVLQLATLRHAIIAPLKQAPVGLEEICLRHFGLCRRRILVQAQRWMLEAEDRESTLLPRFQRAYSELVSLIDEKFPKDAPALAPWESDIKALQSLNKCVGRKPPPSVVVL